LKGVFDGFKTLKIPPDFVGCFRDSRLAKEGMHPDSIYALNFSNLLAFQNLKEDRKAFLIYSIVDI